MPIHCAVRASGRANPALLLPLLIGLAFGGWKFRSSQPLVVETALVKRKRLRASLTATGFVESLQARVAAQMAGRLTAVMVKEHDSVRAGQVLATLDVAVLEAEIAAAHSAAATAQAQAGGAQHAVAASQLQAPGAIGQAQAALDAAQEQLRKLERGSRPEEIGVAEANAQQADAALATAAAQLGRAQIALHQHEAISEATVREAESLVEAARANERRLQAGPRAQEIAQAEAALRETRGRTEQSQKDLARAQKLFEGGATAQQQVDTARTAHSTARENETAARERVSLLRAGTRKEELAAARAEVLASEARLRRAQSAQQDVKLRQQEVEAARTQVTQADAALKAALGQAKLVKAGPRAEDIVVAAARVREARSALTQARASTPQVAVRESEQRAAQANARNAADRARATQARSKDFQLLATFDGVVARRYLDPGETVTPGIPVFLLVDLRHRWIAAELDAEDLVKVRVGQEVTIRAESFPGKNWRGRVREIAAVAEPKPGGRTRARIVRAKVDLLDAADELKPGLEVNVRSGATLRNATLLVPNDAVQTENGGSAFVFVVEGTPIGTARRRKVKVGAHTESETELLEGVREGDHVVIKGKENLTDGARVRIAK